MVEIIRNKWCDDLEDLLQCPICMVRPTSWVYQCIQGHHICVDCKTQLAACPTCCQRWSSARNRLAENLCTKLNDIKLSLIDPESEINKLLIPDRVSVASQTDGEAAASGPPARKATDDHTGPYPCRIGICNVNLYYEPLMKHLKSDHSSQYVELPLGEDSIFRNIWLFDFAEQMMFDRAFVVPGMGTFFLRLSSDCFGNFSGFLLMLHNGFQAKQYTYQLEIECCREHNTCKTYTGEVCSCRTPVSVLTEKCLQIKRVDIQRMLEHQKALTCTVLLGKKPQAEGQGLPPNPNKKKYRSKNNAARPPTSYHNGQTAGSSQGGRPPMNNRQPRPQTAPNGQQGQQGQQGHQGQQGQQGYQGQQGQQGYQGQQTPPTYPELRGLRGLNHQFRQIGNVNRNPPTRTASIPSLLYPNLGNL